LHTFLKTKFIKGISDSISPLLFFLTSFKGTYKPYKLPKSYFDYTDSLLLSKFFWLIPLILWTPFILALFGIYFLSNKLEKFIFPTSFLNIPSVIFGSRNLLYSLTS